MLIIAHGKKYSGYLLQDVILLGDSKVCLREMPWYLRLYLIKG